MGSRAALGRSWVGLGGVLWGVVWSCVALGGLGWGLGWVFVAGSFAPCTTLEAQELPRGVRGARAVKRAPEVDS